MKKIAIIISVLILFSICSPIDTVKKPVIKKEVLFLNLKKGIGMPYPQFQEDLTRSGASWYYNWGACPEGDTKCIPMTWNGEDPNLPVDYRGYLLFLNEPDRPEQANKTPEQAIILYKYYTNKYPNAKLVVGNTFGVSWNLKFKNLCASDSGCIMPSYWGFHSYYLDIYGVRRIINVYNEYHAQIGGIWWITEFANVHGEVYSDNEMVKYFENTPWIEKYAIFCNRAMGTESWFPTSWHDFQLFQWDTGEITPVGKWYAFGLKDIYLPFIIDY